jgi:hypothetical protein
MGPNISHILPPGIPPVRRAWSSSIDPLEKMTSLFGFLFMTQVAGKFMDYDWLWNLVYRIK